MAEFAQDEGVTMIAILASVLAVQTPAVSVEVDSWLRELVDCPTLEVCEETLLNGPAMDRAIAQGYAGGVAVTAFYRYGDEGLQALSRVFQGRNDFIAQVAVTAMTRWPCVDRISTESGLSYRHGECSGRDAGFEAMVDTPSIGRLSTSSDGGSRVWQAILQESWSRMAVDTSASLEDRRTAIQALSEVPGHLYPFAHRLHAMQDHAALETESGQIEDILVASRWGTVAGRAAQDCEAVFERSRQPRGPSQSTIYGDEQFLICLRRLAEFGREGEGARAFVRQMAGESNPVVRAQAIRTLGALGDTEGIRALEPLLQSPHWMEVEALIDAMMLTHTLMERQGLRPLAATHWYDRIREKALAATRRPVLPPFPYSVSRPGQNPHGVGMLTFGHIERERQQSFASRTRLEVCMSEHFEWQGLSLSHNEAEYQAPSIGEPIRLEAPVGHLQAWTDGHFQAQVLQYWPDDDDPKLLIQDGRIVITLRREGGDYIVFSGSHVGHHGRGAVTLLSNTDGEGGYLSLTLTHLPGAPTWAGWMDQDHIGVRTLSGFFVLRLDPNLFVGQGNCIPGDPDPDSGFTR